MTFLAELNVSDIGASGLLIGIIAVLTLLGFIKGAVKLVFFLFTLAGAGYAAYWGADEGLSYIQKSWATAPESLGNILAVVCGLIAFYFLSKIFGFFTDPFENSSFIARFAFGIPAALVSLVAASGLVYFSLTFLKNKGAEEELKYWVTQDETDLNRRLKEYPTLANLKQSFESSTLGKKILGFREEKGAEKLNLAKLLVIANTSAEKINQLAQDERVKKILSNSEVRRLMSDPGIRKQILDNDVKGLLENKSLNSALSEQGLMGDLSWY